MAPEHDIMNQKNPRPLDEDDIALLKTYGLGPYSTSIKKVEKEIKEKAKKINELCGIKESDTGLAPPSQWDLVSDKQMMQEEQPLQVARCTKIISPNTDDAKYMINVKQIAKFVVGLGDKVSPADIEEGMRVGVDLNKYQIQIPLPPKIDPSVTMMTVEEKPDVTYNDVGGCKEQIEKMREVVELPMLHPEKFVKLGIEPPKGVLCYGPPGTGKTLLARAVANRTDACFIHVIGSELVQKYVGEGARMVRELFEMARSKKACIIFFDEVDAIGGARFDDGAGGDNEVQRTMLEIVNQLDGFDARGNIKVLMATNRPDTLDPALLCPGRLDRKVEFGLPDLEGRTQIFKIHTRTMNCERDIRFELLARLCPNSTGADIRSVCTEAGMYAIRARRKTVTEKDFLDSVNKVIKGYQKFSATPKYMGGGYNSTKDETVEYQSASCDSALQNSYRSTRTALFDGIEEGGIRASAYSSHEIDEHENERAIDGLQDLVSILKRVVNKIKKLRKKLRPTDLINVYYMTVDLNNSSRLEEFLQSNDQYIRGVLGTPLVPRAMAPSDTVFFSEASYHIHGMSIVIYYAKCIPVLASDLLPHAPGNRDTSLNQNEIDILCKSFPEDIVASTYWEPGSILIYEATMHAGMTLPLHPFVSSLLNEFRISPAQLMRHGWRAIQSFLTQCDKKQLKPSIDSFLYFFTIIKVPPKDPDRDHYTFKALVPTIMEVPEAEDKRAGRHKKTDWHERFFFIKSKSSERWLFPEKWARGTLFKRKCQLTEGDQEVVKALGGKPSADQCLPPVPAPAAALGSSLPKEQGIEKLISKYEKQIEELKMVCNSKSVECSRTLESTKELGRLKIELQKKIVQTDNLEQVLQKQTIQLKKIWQQYENDKKLWETENMFADIEVLVAECEDLKIKYNEEMAEKKRLHNIVQELKGNIRVFCRCRPLSKVEASLGFKNVVDFDGADDGEIRIVEGTSKSLFKFDKVYAPKDDQAKVYSDASSLVTSVLDGYNVCILAYGQTGTGKTFTMEGTEENRGVNYRTLEELFRVTHNKKEFFTYNISVSMLEVYNEKIRDLLAPSTTSPKKLEIKAASDGSHYVPGIVERKVDNIKKAWDIFQTGSNSRAVGSTDVNEHSSRSHSMLCIMVRAKNLINSVHTKSKLWLVDLAGSERNAKTGAQGDRLEEAKNINRSLSALGNVIAALASSHSHIPYRDSKLTYLLQDFLGGDSKALLFVQISPSNNDLSETVDSLKFAKRVLGVELGPAKRQVDTTRAEKLENELIELQQRIKHLESQMCCVCKQR
ncbi:hypothetical protein ACQ4PT_070885 [Festuca glaucescens]